MGGRPRRGYICRPAKGPAEFALEAPRPAPVRDSIGPVIEVLSPRDGDFVDTAPITISVRVRDDRGVERVAINDAVVRGSKGVYAARMSKPHRGENEVRVEAWDTSGNKSQRAVTFNYAPAPPPDTIEPRVKILAPREGQQLNSRPVWAVVAVKDEGGVARVQINGANAKKDSKGRYRVKRDPPSGQNTGPVIAMDSAGNRGSEQ